MLVGLKKHRGDTIIEVLFATTVFSLVVVGSLAIMNQGTATAQRTLEMSLVRQQIDAQAETLRFLSASYIAAYRAGVDSYSSDTPAGQWQLMQDYITTPPITGSASDFAISGNACPDTPAKSIIMNTRNATFFEASSGLLKPSLTFSQMKYNESDQITDAEGIWVEAIRSDTVLGNNQDNTGYIDFHIRACWDSPGQDTPATLGTIVRLYEPRG